MKSQFYGVEVEMTGVTRKQAADIIAQHFSGRAESDGNGGYKVFDAQNRAWKIVYDGSIICRKKSGGEIITAGADYSVELVTPKLTYDDMDDLQEIIRKLRHAGAMSSSEYKCGIHIHIDASRHTPNTLRNIVNIIAAKEELIYKSLDVDMSRLSYCRKMNEKLINTINSKKPKTLEQLADIWYSDYPMEQRTRHYHSSRYSGINLHSVFEKGTIEFRLFNGTLHAGEIRAFVILCLSISHQALTQKCASPRRSSVTNEKYTFRCWLLRMGFIGEEFKNCRTHLLKNLSGNSSWADPNRRR